MFRTIDRYLIRETLPPFLLVLLVLTFMLEIPPIVEQGEKLLTYGAPATVVARILLTLVPQALAVTIPMSLLFGLLVALGRLSADREIVALQACGVGLRRLLICRMIEGASSRTRSESIDETYLAEFLAPDC